MLLYQSAYQTPAPSYPHLWTRPWDTWTPSLGEANHSLARVDNPCFFLDLEVLTLIPTTSHLVTNHPSKRWRSQPDKAIRTTSSANNSDATLRTPYWTTPASYLEILSMNSTDRIWDQGQPWWSSTLIGNKSDLLPRMQNNHDSSEKELFVSICKH